MTNRHTDTNVKAPQRFYAPGDVIAVAAGVYADDASGYVGTLFKLTDVAFGFGVIHPDVYAAFRSLIRLADENVDGDALERVADELVELLNDANDSETHSWGWHDGCVFYQSEDWWAD